MSPRHLVQAVRRRRRRSALLAKRRAKLQPHYRFAGHGRGRLNVTVVLRKAARPTSSTYIRLYSPLSRPAFGRVGLDIVDEKGLWISPRTDVAIVQRTAFSTTASARSFLREARRVGCIVVVDNDDAFFALDPGHPQYELQVERAEVLDTVMREADEVWLSTEELLAAHPEPRARVVRNTLDLDLWRPGGTAARPSPAPLDAPLRVLYMGTTTHDGDFALIEPVLERLHESHPGQFTVVTVGVARGLAERPWMQVLKPDSGAYPQFVPWLAAQGPFDLGISPLLDSPFNRAKSDIKCLDYLALGALPVVSDVLPYRVDELDEHVRRVPNDAESWYEALAMLVSGRGDLRSSGATRVGAGHDYLRDRRSADLTADVLRGRLDSLRAATRGSTPPTP